MPSRYLLIDDGWRKTHFAVNGLVDTQYKEFFKTYPTYSSDGGFHAQHNPILLELRPTDLFHLLEFVTLAHIRGIIEFGMGRVDETVIERPVADLNLHLKCQRTTNLRGCNDGRDNCKTVAPHNAVRIQEQRVCVNISKFVKRIDRAQCDDLKITLA